MSKEVRPSNQRVQPPAKYCYADGWVISENEPTRPRWINPHYVTWLEKGRNLEYEEGLLEENRRLRAALDDAEKLAESLQNRWASRDLTIERLHKLISRMFLYGWSALSPRERDEIAQISKAAPPAETKAAP